MTEIIYLIFIFPGYFIYTILRSLLKGFGKKADVLDKVIYSMFFNIPVFILSIWINNTFMKNDVIRSIDDLIKIVSMDITLILEIMCMVLLSSFIVCFCVYFIILLGEKVGNKIRGYKIQNFSTVFREQIVKPKYLIPMEIYDIKTNQLIDQGFMKQASCDEEGIHEFCLMEHNLFKQAKDEGVLKDIKYTYNNIDKGYKIVIYDQEHIENIYTSQKREGC